MKALLVIDVQRDYIKGYEPSLLLRINKIILRAQAQGDAVIYVKNVKKLRSGESASEFADNLLLVSENVFMKEKASAFSDPALLAFLRNNDIKQTEFIGVDGNSCVYFSALEAVKEGFEVSLLCEGTGVKDASRFLEKKAALVRKGVKVIEA